MKKILVVDDEQELCALVTKCLQKTGQYQVFSTSLSEEVLPLCKREEPDLLLLDLVMPGADGQELIESLRKEPFSKKMRIVVMSGLGEMVYFEKKDEWRWLPNRPVVQERDEDLVKERSAERNARHYGVDDFLSKPFSPSTLVQVVEEVLARTYEQEKEDV